MHLSHDLASGSVIMPCNKIDKPLKVYSFGTSRNDIYFTLRKNAKFCLASFEWLRKTGFTVQFKEKE